jgi:uncharacterized protein YdcH (DUF465 family)
MEPRDVALIERLLPSLPELRSLWEEHHRLDRQLEELNGRRFLTPEEDARARELRKTKLAGRDRIEAILREHRTGAGSAAARSES